MTQYTIATLRAVRAWALTHPETPIPIPATWPPVTVTGSQWRIWFRGCLDAKINRHQPRRGRKDTPDWERTMRHTAHEVNTPRRIVRWVPRELRTRLAHRLTID